MESTQAPSSRLIAIGDVHGHSLALEALINEINPTANDEIVMLGDYVNRGPDSKGVIERLLKLQNQCRLASILGNHDEMLLDARKDRYAYDRFVMSGGKETVASYGDRKLDTIPDSHWQFLESCVDYHEVKHYAFAHANLCSFTPMKHQLSSVLRWTGIDEMEICNLQSGKVAVVGHSAGDQIRDFKTCVCIDTGCGFGGLLSAYEPSTKRQWQVMEDGSRVH